MKKIISFIIAAIVSGGCISATVEEPALCNSSSLGTIPAVPAEFVGTSVPPISFSIPADLSDTLKKISDVSSQLNVSVTALDLNSDTNLQWVSQVDVSIKGDSQDMPEALFANYKSDGSDPGLKIPLHTAMDSATSFKYLSNPVTLTFTVTGKAPGQAAVLTNTMCVDVSGKIEKSL